MICEEKSCQTYLLSAHAGTSSLLRRENNCHNNPFGLERAVLFHIGKHTRFQAGSIYYSQPKIFFKLCPMESWTSVQFLQGFVINIMVCDILYIYIVELVCQYNLFLKSNMHTQMCYFSFHKQSTDHCCINLPS